MKSLLFVLLLSVSTVTAQIPKAFNFWFYDLPIVKHPEKMFDLLSKDTRFVIAPEDAVQPYLAGDYCSGRIKKMNLPDTLNKIDSGFIELSFGWMHTLLPSKSYAGYYKVLRLVYYSNDSILINQIFDAAYQALGANASERSDILIGRRGGSSEVSEGKGLLYVHNKKRFQKLDIIKNVDPEKTRSVMLQFSVNSDYPK